VKIGQRFRFYPTPSQASTLSRVFGACRWVYNTMLKMRIDAYSNGDTIGYVRSAAIFTKLRHAPETKWLEDISVVPTQQSLRHLQVAYKKFFEKQTGFPVFKKKHSKQSAEYTTAAFRYKISGWGETKEGAIIEYEQKLKIQNGRWRGYGNH
jgi:putative transposase